MRWTNAIILRMADHVILILTLGGAAAADLSDPVELAKRNNQILLDAYKTRLSRANPSARTNMVRYKGTSTVVSTPG